MAKNRRVSNVVQTESRALSLIAVMLNGALKRSGLDAAEVAKRLGVNRRQVTNLLEAKGDPTLKFVARVAEALGCKPQLSFAEVEPGPRVGRRRPQSRMS